MKLKSKKERRKQLFALQWSKNGRVRRFDAPQGPTLLEFVQQGLRLTTRRAFSIAEAMIVFTIVSVAIASVAPMISKQVKYNEMSDLQAKVLNQRIEEVKKSAWKLTPDKKSITRPDDNVGIGVSAGTNPSAKLDIRNNDNNLVGLSVTSPASSSSPILLARKGNVNQFGVTETGRTLIYNGMSMHPPLETGINYLTTWKSSEEYTGDAAQYFRHVLGRDGGIYTHAGGDYAMVLKNDENKNLLVSQSDGVFKVGYRKIGTNENHPRFSISKNGVVTISAPTREEVGGADLSTRDDARALAIYYPKDFGVGKDCGDELCGTPSKDGYTETAFFNSNGSLYINSIIMRRPDGWAGHAVEVRDGVLKRVVVNTDGQLLLYPKNTAKDNYAFVVLTSAEEGGNGRAWIKRDGSAWFNGNVTVDGTIANAELDTKFAKVNDELVESRQIIVKLQNSVDSATQIVAELKSENAQLKEKLAMFEMQLAEVLAQNKLQNIASRQIVKK